MEASEVKRIKELEEENARLKWMYANLAMDNEILRDLFPKKGWPAAKSQLSEELVKDPKIPVGRDCKIVSLTRSQYYYTSVKDDSAVIEALQELLLLIHPMDLESSLLIYTAPARSGIISGCIVFINY